MRNRAGFYRYDIHGIVKVDSNVRPEAVAGVLPMFFLTGRREGEADLTIYAGDFTYKGDGIYREGPFKFGPLRSKFLLDGLEGHAKLFFLSPRYNLLQEVRQELRTLMFELLELKLLQKGHAFIHAACVEKNGDGLMITAPPDTGKTFTTIKLVREHGYSHMADDMTIIGPGGTAYCFPTLMTLHLPHLEELPISLPGDLEASVRARERLRSLPWVGRLLSEPRVDFRAVLPDARVTEKVKVSRLVFLERGKKGARRISRQEAKSRLMPVARMHRSIMSDLIVLYAYYHPELDLHALSERQDELYLELLDRVECYVVSAPDRSFADIMVQHGLA